VALKQVIELFKCSQASMYNCQSSPKACIMLDVLKMVYIDMVVEEDCNSKSTFCPLGLGLLRNTRAVLKLRKRHVTS
jgi:hypothetical protein